MLLDLVCIKIWQSAQSRLYRNQCASSRTLRTWETYGTRQFCPQHRTRQCMRDIHIRGVHRFDTPDARPSDVHILDDAIRQLHYMIFFSSSQKTARIPRIITIRTISLPPLEYGHCLSVDTTRCANCFGEIVGIGNDEICHHQHKRNLENISEHGLSPNQTGQVWRKPCQFEYQAE